MRLELFFWKIFVFILTNYYKIGCSVLIALLFIYTDTLNINTVN